MPSKNHIISNYLARAAEGLVSFYNTRGMSLTQEQQVVALEAFDYASLKLSMDPDHHPDQLLLL